MKKINYILFVLSFVSLTMVSCKKFLEKEPLYATGKNTLFETVEGTTEAMTGCYNTMLSYYKNEFGMYADVTSDNLISRASTKVMLPQFNFQSTTSDDELAVGHIWLNIYETLNNVNNVLGAVPALKTKFPDQKETLDAINGQALAMRALCHFDLSRIYAQPYNYTSDASHLGIPVLLKTPSPGQSISRNTMKETYDQIILDLNNALPLLQQYANHTTQTRFSYHAALALLSRVYLYKGDWAQCIANADKVIADNGYQLATASNYKSIFITSPASNANPKIESIFQLTNALHNNQSTNLSVVFSDALGAQYGASVKIKTSFDSGDIRLSQMFNIPLTGDNAGKSLTTKFGDGAVTTVQPSLIQVIRLSEVYLNRAEAKWNLQKYAEAAEDIRIISQRAHPSTTVTIPSNSSVELYKLIADERNRELCFENHRFFDIARRKESLSRGGDCTSTICSLTYPNNKFVLPIPTKEIEANKAIVQNPGFN